MQLNELQRLMSAALITPEATPPARSGDTRDNHEAFADLFACIESNASRDSDAKGPAGGLSPADRLSIYRNNSRAVRASALEENYPAIRSLVGPDFFGAAARRYAAANPSRSVDLNQYGADFPEFLRQLPGLIAETPYIVDVARFEWMFAEIRRSSPGTTRSAVRLMESHYPVDRIIAACFDEDAPELELPEPNDESESFRFLLYRNGTEVRCRVVDRQLFERLRSL